MKLLYPNSILLVILAMSMSSCALSKIDKSSAPPEDYWEKSGYEKKKIRNFLYENCGYLKRPKPKDFTNKNDFEIAYDNRLIEIEQCMLDNGFLFTLDGQATLGTAIWSDRCSESRLKKLPACLSLTGNISTQPATSNSANSDNSVSRTPPYTAIDPDYDNAIRLQNDIQKQSNRQMDDLLRDTKP